MPANLVGLLPMEVFRQEGLIVRRKEVIHRHKRKTELEIMPALQGRQALRACRAEVQHLHTVIALRLGADIMGVIAAAQRIAQVALVAAADIVPVVVADTQAAVVDTDKINNK